MSILEVLFAILVTTIGLFGAIAVFPVASAMARKGRISDAAGVVGRSGVHIFNARGYRRPDMWVGWSQSWETRASPPAPAPQPGFHGVTSIGLAAPGATSFCIDPRFIAANIGTPARANAASIFPYVQTAVAPGPRMFRIGLTNGLPSSMAGSSLMGSMQADSIFVVGDDPVFTRPDDGSLPAFGGFTRVDHDNDGPTGTPELPMNRSNEGHLSWLATLVPKHEMYAGSAVVQNDLYVLSIVVFYDRPLVDFSVDPIPAVTSPPDTTETMYNLAERCAEVDFADAGGLGYAGGETYLIWPPDGSTVLQNPTNDAGAARALKVRAGDWIMLAGNAPHALGGVLPIFKWYRVTEADHDPVYHPAPEQHYAVAVSLAGQDWDTNLFAQQATIVTGVVGVYEKTIRLETGSGF